MKYNKKLLIRQTLRIYKRSLRKKLTPKQQNNAAKTITHNIKKYLITKKTKKIALFMSFDGEINTMPLIDICLKYNKEVYLPIINPNQNNNIPLLFGKYHLSKQLTLNKFKILEPVLKTSSVIDVKKLDILFVPIVAFDKKGNRLGMGKGYYDRILHYCFYDKNNNTKPIGLAHECQQTKRIIPTEKWDIPLPEIITPQYHWYWKNNKQF